MARPGFQRHPKFQRLVYILGEPESHVRGYLEYLWEVAYEAGNPKIGDAVDVELAAKYPGTRGKLAAALVEAKLLDLENDTYHIHDLYDHCPEYVKKRMDRENARESAGVSLSEKRAAAARRRWKMGKDANGMQTASTCIHLHSFAMQNDANDMQTADSCMKNDAIAMQTAASGTTPSPIVSSKEDTYSCSEPQATAPEHNEDDPVVLTFPTKGKGKQYWHLRQSKINEYNESFPNVDVMAECRRALQWCRDYPVKRKTASGMAVFLSNWLGREQNKPRQFQKPPNASTQSTEMAFVPKPIAGETREFLDRLFQGE